VTIEEAKQKRPHRPHPTLPTTYAWDLTSKPSPGYVAGLPAEVFDHLTGGSHLKMPMPFPNCRVYASAEDAISDLFAAVAAAQ